MTTRVHSELRKLALAYYRGWIPREKYLSIRKDYLAAITRDEIPERIDSKQIAPPPPETPYKVTKKRKQRMSLAISVAAIIVIGIALAVFMTGTDEQRRPVKQQPTAQPLEVQQQPVDEPSMEANADIEIMEPPVAAKPVSAEERFATYLEDEFIGQRTWSQESLDSLKLKWLALSQEQQQSTRETGAFKDFTNSLIE